MLNRYTPGRKAQLVCQALHDPSTAPAILKEHGFSPEEFSSMVERYVNRGKNALRSTRVQEYPLARAA